MPKRDTNSSEGQVWTLPRKRDNGASGPPSAFRSVRVSIHARARADRITVAINIVDAPDRRPELMFAQPGRGVTGLVARIGAFPFVGDQYLSGVRRIFEQVVLSI